MRKLTAEQERVAENIITRMLETAEAREVVRPVHRWQAELVEDYCLARNRTLLDLLERLVELGACRDPDSIILPGFQFGGRVRTLLAFQAQETVSPTPAVKAPPARVARRVDDQLGWTI